MAGNTLSVTLVNGTNVTATLTTNDWPDAKTSAQNFGKYGFYDDAGVFHPGTAVLSVTII